MNIPVRVNPDDAARYRKRAEAEGTTLAAIAREAWEGRPPMAARDLVAALEPYVQALKGTAHHQPAVKALASLEAAFR